MAPQTDIVVRFPDVEARLVEYRPLLTPAVTVSNPDELKRQLERMRGLKGAIKFFTETHEETITLAHKAHKAAIRTRDSYILPFSEAYSAQEALCKKFEREEEQRRLAEQRLAEERLRQAALAEQQAEEARLLDMAAAAETSGDAEHAAELLEAATATAEVPVEVPIISVAPPAPKVEGVASRKSYSAKVTDKIALIQFVAANPQFAAYLDANMPGLNAQARSLRENLNIPGVRVVENIGYAMRG